MHYAFERTLSLLAGDDDDDVGGPFVMIRKDEHNLTCIPPSVLEFPNVMRKKAIWSTAVCFLASIYMFIILAVVCDDYLVPAMERLCYTLRMSYDVAGATFLAAATSAPELFVSIVGTFVTKGDIGIGTIVGSSVFNVLGIASVCGILTGVSMRLDWWPITRDTFWYFVSIAALFGVLHDSIVTVYEAGGLLCFYVVYLVTMLFDRRIQKLCRTIDSDKDMMNENPLDREDDPLKTFKETVCEKPEEGSNCCKKFWYGIKYPAVILLAVTVPSARSIFFLSMLMAVMWICAISYLVTWFLTVIGYNLGIPDSIMGLTVLAFGTSVPEIVSSYIVFRKGYGGMAMCNAIGSNTFDIFICLGLPWFIDILVQGHEIVINSSGIAIVAGMLMITAGMLYASLLATKFVLGKIVGWISFVLYVLFLSVACALEILMLKKTCDIESKQYEFLND